jgi:RNA polymerase sigma-70 factor, ECF subfamily
MVFESIKLLELAKQGDMEALGRLFDQYRPYLHVLGFRYLDPRLQGRLDPMDIVQQSFMEAHRDFPNFRGEDIASLLAWLRNILRNNVATAHQRHLYTQRRTAAREVEFQGKFDSPSEFVGMAELVPSETTSPSQRVMRDETAAKLASCMEKLPESQAEAIRLRYLEGLSLKQISERIQKSEMAVAGLLKRGLQNLRLDLLDSQSS